MQTDYQENISAVFLPPSNLSILFPLKWELWQPPWIELNGVPRPLVEIQNMETQNYFYQDWVIGRMRVKESFSSLDLLLVIPCTWPGTDSLIRSDDQGNLIIACLPQHSLCYSLLCDKNWDGKLRQKLLEGIFLTAVTVRWFKHGRERSILLSHVQLHPWGMWWH